ncbi:hypothetical protein GCM10029992_17180 [Glycomyces albus]
MKRKRLNAYAASEEMKIEMNAAGTAMTSELANHRAKGMLSSVNSRSKLFRLNESGSRLVAERVPLGLNAAETT